MRVVAEVAPRAPLQPVRERARRLGCDLVLRNGRAYLVRREDEAMTPGEAR